MQATSVIYCGLQLLLPGEQAPAHRHAPSAARIVIEGEGAYTVVDGEKCPMQRGDLILTPGGMWHDHGHEGRGHSRSFGSMRSTYRSSSISKALMRKSASYRSRRTVPMLRRSSTPSQGCSRRAGPAAWRHAIRCCATHGIK